MTKPKITLRKYRMSDLDRVCELFLDDEIIDNLAMPMKAKDITKKKEAEWIKKTIKEYKSKKPGSLNLAITLNGEYVGSLGAHKIDYNHEKMEVGYWVGKPYWGQGIATEALKQLLKCLHKRFKFKRISAIAYSHNIGSQRVLEKAGFKFEGEMRKSTKRFGKFYNDRIYALVK